MRDGSGNVSTVTNNRDTSRAQTFTYDNLNRVATGQSQATSGGNCWGQSFGYDRYANLTTVSVTKCSAPMLSLSVNTQNRITNSGFNYDAAGDMTADGTYSYTWNGENRLSTPAGVTYTYDGLGQRVKKSNGKLYWFGVDGNVLAESDLSGNTTAELIYFAGQRIAWRNSSGSVYYIFADQLGSLRTMTNATGVIQKESDYYPFGTERQVVNTVDLTYKFPGMEYDPETGAYHTLYRQDSPNLGRWSSPDPERSGVDNPQAFNLYAYVVDNPTNLVDPLGLQGVWSGPDPSDPCSDVWYASSHAECGGPPGPCVAPGACPPFPRPGPGGHGGGGGGGAGGTGDVLAQNPPPTTVTWPPADPTTGITLTAILSTLQGLAVECLATPVCWGPALAVGTVVVAYTGYRIYQASKTKVPTVQELKTNCTPGQLIREPSRTYPGGTSYNQEYICPGGGVWWVHWIEQNGRIVHGPHIRKSPPTTGGED